MTYNTGNPIGSTDARDRSDNSENLDLAVNSLEQTFVDRLGRTRDTLEGIYQKSAYYRAGTFDSGYTLTNNRQTLAYGNVEYSWSGVFPKIVTAGSTPATSGGVGVNAWIDRTQETVKLSLLSNFGASIVYTSTGATVEERLSSQNTSIAGKASLAGSASQAFSVANATTDTQAAPYGQVKSRTKKGGLTQSISGNALTLSYASRLLQFRNATLTDGTAVEVTPSENMGLTLPSGCSIGGASGIPLDIFVLGIYNGGTPVIGVVNAAGGLVLDESGLISSTAISASATSASVVYSSVAVTNSPYIILSRLSVTLPTAGAWSVLPTVTPIDLISIGMLEKRLFIPIASLGSATSFVFTGIPSWARKITILGKALKSSAGSFLYLQLGTSSGFVTSGYVGKVIFETVSDAALSAYFALMNANSSGDKWHGTISLISTDGLTWTLTSRFFTEYSSAIMSCIGDITLTAALTQLKLTTVSGTDALTGYAGLLIEG